jgi:hypothetical protein
VSLAVARYGEKRDYLQTLLYVPNTFTICIELREFSSFEALAGLQVDLRNMSRG